VDIIASLHFWAEPIDAFAAFWQHEALSSPLP